MISTFSGKAVKSKARNIRNTEKPALTITVKKKTIRVKTLKVCLGFVLCHTVLAVLSDMKINIYEAEFPPPHSHIT
jgi:hypothetical protein